MKINHKHSVTGSDLFSVTGSISSDMLPYNYDILDMSGVFRSEKMDFSDEMGKTIQTLPTIAWHNLEEDATILVSTNKNKPETFQTSLGDLKRYLLAEILDSLENRENPPINNKILKMADNVSKS